MQYSNSFPLHPGSVGHHTQSVPGEIFARAHFHLIAERETSLRTECDMKIWLDEEAGLLSMVKEISNDIHPFKESQLRGLPNLYD